MSRGEGESKRRRVDGAVFPGPLSDVFTDGSVKRLKQEYSDALPYPHAVISPLCREDGVAGESATLMQVRDEIVANVTSTYKETDLFKLYQTTDLANIDATEPEIAAKLPTLMKLRDALYSPEVREFVGEVTGHKGLTDRVDMAASAYSQGCHLLCHDDVIGTRAVSFIVYLTDPGWTAEDGGALELYPLAADTTAEQAGKTRGSPVASPSKQILPLANTMAFFGVEPGVSYHSVQEVFTDKSPRLSIQGWYHAATAPAGAEMASVSQLKNAEAESLATMTPFAELAERPTQGDGEPTCLSDAESAVLAEWIVPTYLLPEQLAKIRARFEEVSSVQLRDFLISKSCDSIAGACRAADVEDGLNIDGAPLYTAGLKRPGWKEVGPAHMQRYLRAHSEVAPETDSAARELTGLRQFLESEAFAAWMWVATGVRPLGRRGEARRFRPGLDYTVAHQGSLQGEMRLDATYCFVDDQSEEAAAVWESGETGAFQCYIAADDEDTVAAEVYVNDDAEGNELLSIAPTSNTLNLVLHGDGTMRFEKYVSTLALGSRWDVITTFSVADDDIDKDADADDALNEDDE